MNFRKSDIQEVNNYVAVRAESLGVRIPPEEYMRLNRVLDNINRQKQYKEGEEIDPKHMGAIRTNIATTIDRLGKDIVQTADMLNRSRDKNASIEYLETAVDLLYILAMDKLGCPNMPVIHFDNGIKETVVKTASVINKIVITYDVSEDDAFNRQRGKDAVEVSKNFNTLVNKMDKVIEPEPVGKMIAEYQALKRRQEGHGGIWRFFHRTENKARTDLLKKMSETIKKYIPKEMGRINIDEVLPANVAHGIAGLRIEAEVDLEVSRRFNRKEAADIYGCPPSTDEYVDVEEQKKLFEQFNSKIPMNENEKFVNDINGSVDIDVSQVSKEKEVKNINVVKG